MTTYYPSQKLSQLDEPGMQDTGEVGMYSCGPLHMDKQKQDDQLEPTYNSCANMGCSPEDLLEAMDDREGWQERVKDICADGMTWDVQSL